MNSSIIGSTDLPIRSYTEIIIRLRSSLLITPSQLTSYKLNVHFSLSCTLPLDSTDNPMTKSFCDRFKQSRLKLQEEKLSYSECDDSGVIGVKRIEYIVGVLVCVSTFWKELRVDMFEGIFANHPTRRLLSRHKRFVIVVIDITLLMTSIELPPLYCVMQLSLTCLKPLYIIWSSRLVNFVNWHSVSSASGRKFMWGPSISSNSLSNNKDKKEKHCQHQCKQTKCKSIVQQENGKYMNLNP